MSRTAKVVLGVSLVLNLLFAGYIGGRMFRDFPPRPFMAPIGMAWLVQSLPEARRKTLEPQLRAAFANIRPHLKAMHQAQAGVETALTRQQFDRAEMQRALAVMQARSQEMMTTSQNALVDIAAQLTPEERQRLAHTLRAPPWPGGFHMHHGSNMGGSHMGFGMGHDDPGPPDASGKPSDAGVGAAPSSGPPQGR